MIGAANKNIKIKKKQKKKKNYRQSWPYFETF